MKIWNMNTGAIAESNMTVKQWENMTGALMIECHRDVAMGKMYYYYEIRTLKGNNYIIQVSYKY